MLTARSTISKPHIDELTVKDIMTSPPPFPEKIADQLNIIKQALTEYSSIDFSKAAGNIVRSRYCLFQ